MSKFLTWCLRVVYADPRATGPIIFALTFGVRMTLQAVERGETSPVRWFAVCGDTVLLPSIATFVAIDCRKVGISLRFSWLYWLITAVIEALMIFNWSLGLHFKVIAGVVAYAPSQLYHLLTYGLVIAMVTGPYIETMLKAPFRSPNKWVASYLLLFYLAAIGMDLANDMGYVR
ncbi:hypothetical protein HGB07_03920 [Candidatus Roizmanbacteria bacterium]|nr:hypothetical protein [Candidatus Roizmanbacteria bacterium]